MLISESHFTNLTTFKIPHYSVYNTPHPDGTAHGGTAIIIRNTIPHQELSTYQTDKIQATSVEIRAIPWYFTVSAVYSPPRHAISTEEYKDLFQTLGNIFIIGGDWNAKNTHWGSRLITTKGRNLLRAMLEKNYDFLSNGVPTYWPSDPRKIPDLLDFFIIKGISKNNCTVESNSDLTSDHTPVIISLSTTLINKSTSPRLTTKNTNWAEFRKHINEHINLNLRLKFPEDLDEAAQYFTRIVQKASWYSTPQINQQTTNVTIPLHIRQLVAKKRRARKIWQRTRNPIDQHQYNRLARHLKTALRDVQNNEFEAYITNLSANDYTLWKATKKLKRPQIPVPPIRKANGEWARSDKEKADTFAAHLNSVFEADPGVIDQEVEDFVDAACQMSLPIKAFSPKEVKTQIDLLNTRKTPGYDLITPQILKQLPRKAIVLLTTIFNRMLSLTYFPTIWKYAEIIMIHKPGKPPHNPTSYRPISLLTTTSKVFERLLLQRIYKDHESLTLLPDHQFGFRERHSTTHQVHRIVNEISKTLEEKKYCNAVFLDISQAFDKVWHRGLLFKLKKNLLANYYLLLKSYLCNRHYSVKFKGDQSDFFPIESGVPQGSVLGPLLFLIYTRDIPETENTKIASFADDVAVLATSEDPARASDTLQNYLNSLSEWYTKWRTKVNQTKSVQVTFTMRRSTCPPLTMNNVQIPVATEAKYLGLHLDQRLTWRKHIQSKRTQMDLKLKQMYWLLGRKTKLSLENKILLYKAILKPIWSYGIQLWGSAKPTTINIIQRFQSKTLRTITNAPWYVSNRTLHDDLRIPFITSEIRRISLAYKTRTANHENELIEHLYVSGPINRRLLRKWPEDLVQ